MNIKIKVIEEKEKGYALYLNDQYIQHFEHIEEAVHYAEAHKEKEEKVQK